MEEASVRGTYVRGLRRVDVLALDAFEGEVCVWDGSCGSSVRDRDEADEVSMLTPGICKDQDQNLRGLSITFRLPTHPHAFFRPPLCRRNTSSLHT